MKRIYLLLLLLSIVSCEQLIVEGPSQQSRPIPENITIGFEDDSTRIQLNDEGKTVWNNGDLVSVFYKSYDNMKWMFSGKTGDRSGDLQYVDGELGEQTMDEVMIVYPYDESYRIDLETRKVEASIPDAQYYAERSYGKNSNIMVASSDYRNFTMKSVCGWLRIELKGNGEKVSSMKLYGNHGEQLAGDVYIDTEDASLTLCSDIEDTPEDDGDLGGHLNFPKSVLESVTLYCGSGVTLSAEPTQFYISLPPQRFYYGATVEIVCTNGASMTIGTDDLFTLRRNHIIPIDGGVFNGSISASNEIKYSTNDGEPLVFASTDGFGADLVENSYDSATGIGTIRFASNVTSIPNDAFASCTTLTWLGLPSSITTIGDRAFKGCSSMDNITIPSSVTKIGVSSFEGCAGRATINCRITGATSTTNGKFYKAAFSEVTIGREVTSIGYGAFANCESLQKVTISSGVSTIGNFAFLGCTSLSEITLPASVTWMGRRLFYNCSSLVKVNAMAATPPVANYAGAENWQTFDKCAEGLKIYVPASAVSAYQSADGWSEYEGAIVAR